MIDLLFLLLSARKIDGLWGNCSDIFLADFSGSTFGGAFFNSTTGSFSLGAGSFIFIDDGTFLNLGLKNFGSVGDGDLSLASLFCRVMTFFNSGFLNVCSGDVDRSGSDGSDGVVDTRLSGGMIKCFRRAPGDGGLYEGFSSSLESSSESVSSSDESVSYELSESPES